MPVASLKEKIEDLPLTSYPLYSAFFSNPIEEAFMYPLKYYAKSSTTGSMGKPKGYLHPIPLDIDILYFLEKANLLFGSDYRLVLKE